MSKTNNSIVGAFKRKEYGWGAAYIFLAVVSLKLAGIGGIIGVSLAMEGIYRTYKNSEWSKTKKAIIALAYALGGVVISVVILYSLTFALTKLGFGQPQSEVARQILESSTASSSETTVNKGTPEEVPNVIALTQYSSEKKGFKIQYPKGWTISEDGANGTAVEFDNPDANDVGAETVGIDSGMSKYSVKQYAAGVMEGFSGATGKDEKIEIINQGDTSIAGLPAYKVEFRYAYPMPDGTELAMHAISISLIRGDNGYNVFASTQEAIWGRYSKVLQKSLESFSL